MTKQGYAVTTPWIGVDMDGTLARYPENARGLPWNVFGDPIATMVVRMQAWLAKGKDVRIVTARVFPYIHDNPVWAHFDDPSLNHVNHCMVTGDEFTIGEMRAAIQDYTQRHVGKRLPVTCGKNYQMIELWDDRAVQVIPNTGRTLADEYAAVLTVQRGKAQG